MLVIAAGSTFLYQESTMPDLPKDPINIPKSELSNDYLIRQSSILSSEAASRLLMFITKSVDDVVLEYLNVQKELANLYELSSDEQFSLTEAGQDRMLELRRSVHKLKKDLQDLELLFEYVKKLMDANSEVSFLVGEGFCSQQCSERIQGAIIHVTEKLDSAKMAEMDCTLAQKLHIEKTGKEDNEGN